MNSSTDLGKSFRKLICSIFTPYGGCIIEKGNGKYKVGSATFDSMDQAIAYIDTKFVLVDGRIIEKEKI
jgi:hypothetical protein